MATAVDTELVCASVKWGTAYPTEQVNRLFRAVARNTRRKLRFLCMTESPDGLSPGIEWLPLVPPPFEARMLEAQKTARHRKGALRKIALFNPANFPGLQGPVLVLDIDVVITGNLDDIADLAPGKVAMRVPFNRNPVPFTRGQGSVIKFEPARHGFLYDTMAENPVATVARCGGSEQSYTSMVSHDRSLLAPIPEDWVISFKYHCRPPKPLNWVLRPRLPRDARIVCFHGTPDIPEAITGYWRDPFEMSRPAPWIADYWT